MDLRSRLQMKVIVLGGDPATAVGRFKGDGERAGGVGCAPLDQAALIIGFEPGGGLGKSEE